MDFPTLLNCILGGTTLTSAAAFIANWRTNRVKEGQSALAVMQSTVDNSLKMYDDLLARCKDYQRTIDEQVTRTREVADRLYRAEQECNRLNERNHEQAARLTAFMLEVEHWKHWHCRRCDCQDPRGREPQQDPPEVLYLPYIPPE